MTTKLQFLGEVYVCSEWRCKKGEVVEVDDQKAVQLLVDFPKNWKRVASSVAAVVSHVPAMVTDEAPNEKTRFLRYQGVKPRALNGTAIKFNQVVEVSEALADELLTKEPMEWSKVRKA